MIRRWHFNSDVTISFPKLGFKKQLLVYADASFQNLADGGSQGGYIVFLTDPEMNMCHPLSWSSKRIRLVVKSTLAAGTLALQDGLDDAFYIMELYQFILGEKIGFTAITDSLSLYNAVYSSKVVEEKRLKIDISSKKELIEKNMAKVCSGSIRNANLLIVWRNGPLFPRICYKFWEVDVYRLNCDGNTTNLSLNWIFYMQYVY